LILELNYDWNLQVGEKEAPKELYVAMTSDRGLAGAVHSSICKAIRYKTAFILQSHRSKYSMS
jgi:F0F1-type ATP synthase gamma subunit